MKANYERKVPKVLSGNGTEWSNVSNSVEKNFYDWLAFSDVSEEDFCEAMKGESYDIVESVTDNNGKTVKSISVYTKQGILGVPFLYEERDDYSYVEFKTDVLLLLFYISGKYLSKPFDKAIQDFSKKVIH